MKFSFTADHRQFAEGLRDLLRVECTPAAVRAVWDAGTGHDASLWAKLADIGVLDLLVPEHLGGFGGSEVDAVLLWQELGRACTPGPVVEHMLAAPLLRAVGIDAPIATLWLDGPYVAHGQIAEIALADGELIRPAVVDPIESIDGGRLLAEWPGLTTEPTAEIDGATLFDQAAVATAAYLIGLAEAMIDLTAAYARDRHQFGKPIGSFQAVKHLMSDALLQVEFAKPATYRAAWSCATSQPTRARDVSMAKAFASQAAYRASRSCMQVHGGIGYTWEADLQLYMKKAWALMRAYGDATFHRRRVADAVIG